MRHAVQKVTDECSYVRLCMFPASDIIVACDVLSQQFHHSVQHISTHSADVCYDCGNHFAISNLSHCNSFRDVSAAHIGAPVGLAAIKFSAVKMYPDDVGVLVEMRFCQDILFTRFVVRLD